jgi:hypothetical protein
LGTKHIGTLIQGASQHFTNKKDWYIDFVENISNSDSIVLSGREEYRVEGKGSVQLQMRGKRLLFRDVYYILVWKKNLLSISWIMKHSPHLVITMFSSNNRLF